MKKRLVGMALVSISYMLVGFAPDAFASTSGVVISQLQTGGLGSGTATQEFVEIANTSVNDVDVTDWCVSYSSASDGSQSTLGCLRSPDSSTHIWLRAGGYVTFASLDYAAAVPMKPDILFDYSGGMSGTAGHVRLLDGSKFEQDKLAWGVAALHPETLSAAVPSGGASLQRLANDTGIQDTDNNSADFQVNLSPVAHIDGIYDVVEIIDVCANIEGDQSILPAGYEVDEIGDCYVDTCNNIGGLQIDLPEGYKFDINSFCMLDLKPLVISELLPNVSGSDIGKEFIELYNPNDTDVALANYVLKIGFDDVRLVGFSDEAFIQPHSYMTFYNPDGLFTLLNTTSRVGLFGIDDQEINVAQVYENPKDDAAWALIDGIWVYSNRPTPGLANLAWFDAPLLDDADSATDTLKPCAPNQYRSPETNRCRTIVTAESTLTPCKEGQYRSEETNRCRSIVVAAASVLKPCADDQYRNPTTGRCKQIASTEDVAVADCGEGRERNPETNRCRNIATTSIPDAAFAVEPVSDTAEAFIGWWALGGVGALALGYAGWEWRSEFMAGIRKFGTFLTANK